MQTTLSTKGQVVLPEPVRRRFNLRPGDPLTVSVGRDTIILKPRSRRLRARIITDTKSGLPVLSVGPNAPKLSSDEVAAILANFP